MTDVKQVPENAAEIVCVLDRSGSMALMAVEVINGFNEFIKEQREVGPGTVTLILFDDKYEVVYENKPLGLVERLTDKTYFTRGWTALNDAIGRTIADIRERHQTAKTANPQKTIMVVITDGQENSSKEFTDKSAVLDLVEKARADGWEILFLAANMDAFAEAQSYGVPQYAAMNYVADSAGMTKAFSAASAATTSGRIGADLSDTNWRDKDNS